MEACHHIAGVTCANCRGQTIPQPLDYKWSYPLKTYADGINDAIKIVRGWHDAYPEDIFTKHPKELESAIASQERYETLITQVSAAMGRHMSKRLLEQLDELKATAGAGE